MQTNRRKKLEENIWKEAKNMKRSHGCKDYGGQAQRRVLIPVKIRSGHMDAKITVVRHKDEF